MLKRYVAGVEELAYSEGGSPPPVFGMRCGVVVVMDGVGSGWRGVERWGGQVG